MRGGVTLLVAVLVSALTTATLRAQPRLAVQGDHFALDGRGQFLLLVSYFDGLARPAAVLRDDLAWLSQRGVRGIRVWPNAPPASVLDASGRVDAEALARLVALVDEAARQQLVVDITFHREALACPRESCTFTAAEYGAGVAAVAGAVRHRGNVLVDIQNEWNDHGQVLTQPELVLIRQQVATAAPGVPVMTSVTAGYGEAQAAAGAFDVLAYHDWRDAYGQWADDTEPLVDRLRGALSAAGADTLPIYFQEPNRFPRSGERRSFLDSTPAHYWTAARAAKRAGAAAWTFHTAAGFALASPTPFAELLLPAEREVLEALGASLPLEQTWGIRTPTDPLPPIPAPGPEFQATID